MVIDLDQNGSQLIYTWLQEKLFTDQAQLATQRSMRPSQRSANLRVGALVSLLGVGAVAVALWNKKRVEERVDFDKPLPKNLITRGAFMNYVRQLYFLFRVTCEC